MIIRCFITLLLLTAIGGCSVQPEAFSQQELSETAIQTKARVAEHDEPVVKPITLYEAMARALKYNLDARVERLDAALKQRQLDLQSMDQLPKIVAESDWNHRNNDAGSSSESLLTHTQSLEPSTSSDRTNLSGDLSLSWNIMDFGLSYVRAIQSADRVLIAQEKRRKAIQSLIQDVRSAYWRTMASERLTKKLIAIDERLRAAHKDVNDLEKKGDSSPLVALTYERELLELQVELQRMQGELKAAKAQLAGLINLPPDAKFEIAASENPSEVPQIDLKISEMLGFALEHRPELRDAGYNVRINQQETTAALLEMLPSLAPYINANADANSFLYNSNWVTAGAKASWNIIKVFSYPARKRAIEAEADYLDKKRLATAMLIMTQVSVSRMNYFHTITKFHTAQRYYEVEQKISKQMTSAAGAGSISQHSLLRQEMRVLVAEVKRNLSYVEAQNAYGTMFVSLGADNMYLGVDDSQTVTQMANTLSSNWRSMAMTHARQITNNPHIVAAIAK